MLHRVSFSKEENICGKLKYVVPWSCIDVDSDQPIKRLAFRGKKGIGCSEGNIIIYDNKGCLFRADFNVKSFDPFVPLLCHPGVKGFSQLAISNDQKLSVSFFNKVYTKRRKLRNYNPHFDVCSENRITIMKVLHKDCNKELCKELPTIEFTSDIHDIKISQKNNYISLVYCVRGQYTACKVFKMINETIKVVFTKKFEDDVDDYDDLMTSYSMFNQREDLVLIVFQDQVQKPCTILVYDIINDKETIIPFDKETEWLNIEIVSTANQDLVFICDQASTVLKVFDIDIKKSSPQNIIEWDIDEELDIDHIFERNLCLYWR
eukprot:TCONS_00014756-protein